MKAALLWLIRLYQRYISPGLPRRCRFSPTCSQYAVEAITKYGAAKGKDALQELIGFWADYTACVNGFLAAYQQTEGSE